MRDGDAPPAPSTPDHDNAHGRPPAATFPRPAPPPREAAAAPEPPPGAPPAAPVPSRAPTASITIIPARDTSSAAGAALDPASALGGGSPCQSGGGGALVARGLEGLEGGAALNLVPWQRQELLSPLECNASGPSARPHCVIDCRFCRYVCEGRISPSSGGISPIRSPNRRSPTLILSPRGSPGSEYLLPGLPISRDSSRGGGLPWLLQGPARRVYSQRFL